MVRNLKPEDREALDDELLSRPEAVDPETGLKPPSWWRGEEDAAQAAQGFFGNVNRRGR